MEIVLSLPPGQRIWWIPTPTLDTLHLLRLVESDKNGVLEVSSGFDL